MHDKPLSHPSGPGFVISPETSSGDWPRTRVVYRILQIVRGGKVSRMDKALHIRWKTFAVRVKMCLRAYAILSVNRAHLLNNSE